MNRTEECKPTAGPKRLYSIGWFAIAAYEWEDALLASTGASGIRHVDRTRVSDT